MSQYEALPQRNKDGTLVHVIKDGSRQHVPSWSYARGKSVVRCSEPECEVNRAAAAMAKEEGKNG